MDKRQGGLEFDESLMKPIAAERRSNHNFNPKEVIIAFGWDGNPRHNKDGRERVRGVEWQGLWV